MNEHSEPGAGADRTAGESSLMTEAEIDRAIRSLEAGMEQLQTTHPDLFSFANAWAEHYDALIAATPVALRLAVEQRLQRIGIRWGVALGVRMTREFPALK